MAINPGPACPTQAIRQDDGRQLFLLEPARAPAAPDPEPAPEEHRVPGASRAPLAHAAVLPGGRTRRPAVLPEAPEGAFPAGLRHAARFRRQHRLRAQAAGEDAGGSCLPGRPDGAGPGLRLGPRSSAPGARFPVRRAGCGAGHRGGAPPGPPVGARGVILAAGRRPRLRGAGRRQRVVRGRPRLEPHEVGGPALRGVPGHRPQAPPGDADGVPAPLRHDPLPRHRRGLRAQGQSRPLSLFHRIRHQSRRPSATSRRGSVASRQNRAPRQRTAPMEARPR